MRSPAGAFLTGRAGVMDESLRIGLVGIAAPAVIAGAGTVATMLLGGRGDQPNASPEARGFAGALAASVAAIAFAVGVIGVRGESSLGWSTLDHRLLITALTIAATGALFMQRSRVRSLVIATGLLGAIASMIVIGSGLWDSSAGTLREFAPHFGPVAWLLPIITLGVAAAWAAGVCWAIQRSTTTPPRLAAPVFLLGITLAVAGGLTGTGSRTLGLYGFAAAATVFGACAAVTILRRATLPPAIIAVASVVLSTLLTTGVMFSSTPLWIVALLGVAPLLGVGVEMLLLRSARPWVRAGTRIGVAAVVAGIAVAPGIIVLAKFMFGSQPNDPYSESPR